MSEAPKSSKRAVRRTLLIMATVFAVPYGLAWLLYFNPGLLDLDTRNHGTMISPMIGPDQFQLLQSDGQPLSVLEDSDRWMLLSFGEGACDEGCERTLFTLQQLRKMLGVEKVRMRRAYVMPDNAERTQMEAELVPFEGTELLLADPAQLDWLEEKLGVESGQLPQHIVIADPKSNLVMLYPRDMEPKKIFADIEILFGRVKRV